MKTDIEPRAKLRLDYQSPDFTINETHLRFELDEHKTKVTSRLIVERLNSQSNNLVLDGEDLKLLAISVNQHPLNDTQYQLNDTGIAIPVSDDRFEIQIEVEIDPKNNTKLEGLYKSGQAYCTQCEAEGFRRITYYLDRPDVLSVFTTEIIANPTTAPYALANGNKVSTESLSNGKVKTTWHDPFKKPSYLFALVAGSFDLLKDSYRTASGREVALQFFVDEGNKHKAEFAMGALKRAMKWDEEVFGLEYDLDIYMVVAVDFFNMGAMENKGLNVFNSRFVLADNRSATDSDYHYIESVIGHEYFHNWTGNRITCRDWFQLSLKEGLTVFRDQQFSADMGSPVVNRIDAVKVLRGHQFAEDAGPMAHPIRPDKVIEMNNFYTVTVYDKGAEVIRMMHTLLGQQGFRKGMDRYFDCHDGTAVTCDDFVNAMAEANQQDFEQFKRWYSQSGTPVVTATISQDIDNGRVDIHFKQSHPKTADKQPKQALVIPIKLEVIGEKGSVNAINQDDGSAFTGLFVLTQTEQTLSLSGINEKITVSLFQDFSAPVKVQQSPLPNATWIIEHASDDFSRWDAAQLEYRSAIINTYHSLINQNNGTTCLDAIVSALKAVLSQSDEDPQFIALLLELPSIAEVMEYIADVDMLVLDEARRRVEAKVAESLESECQKTVTLNIDKGEGDSPEQIGARALTHACLNLLAYTETPPVEALNTLFRRSNMTDKYKAIAIAGKHQLDCYATMLGDFNTVSENDSIIADKYLSLVGGFCQSNFESDIERAKQHPLYEDTNPNKVRALFGSFFNANIRQFYDENGKGFELFTKLLTQVDATNPQLASRLITPALAWNKLCLKQRQGLHQVLLKLKATPDLSKDLYEKVTKALES